jgi:putative transposase
VAVGAPKLFAFTRGPKSQWKSIRASNAIVPHPEGAEGGGNRRMSYWYLLATGQITIAKIEGWRNLAERPFDQFIDLGA